MGNKELDKALKHLLNREESHTPQPPAGDDLVARLREGVAYLGSIEGDIETYDIDSANELMLKAVEALTSQLPAGGDLVARLREIADRKRIVSLPPDAEDGLRAAIEALTSQQHTEVAGEVERLRKERDYAVRWANRSVDQVKEGIDALEARIQCLERALTPDLVRKLETYLSIYTGDKELRGMIERIRTALSEAEGGK